MPGNNKGGKGSKLPEKLSNEHSYSQSQRRTRQPASAPAVSSDSEVEIDSYNGGDCKKTIYSNESPVECDFCDSVFCFKCSEISTKAQYKKLSIPAKEK